MRPTSAAYASQITTGYQAYCIVQFLQNNVPVASSDDPNATHPFYVVDGSVVVDCTSSFRRQLTLKIVDPTGFWQPNDNSDTLAVTSGAEIYVRSGMLVNGAPEVFDQGYFDIATSEVVDDPVNGVVINVTGFDRARKISRSKVVGVPYIILPNINIVQAVTTLWKLHMPEIKIHVPLPTSHVTTYQVVDEQADPWQVGVDLLTSIGYEGFFLYDGWAVMQPIPDINDITKYVSWQYNEGPMCTVIDYDRLQDNTDIYNGQVVIGASTYGLTPARAVAWDTDIHSPTYYLGPYGQVPNFTQSDKVSYTAQAVDMANGLLLKSKGLHEVVTLNVIPNAAHTEEDIILLNRAASGLVNVKVFIDKMNIPLVAAGGTKMQITCRKRTV